jgi:Zinc-finger of C2H2 type/Zinc-finger double-stranded RNA-binding
MDFINNTPFVFFREGWAICGCGKSYQLHKIDEHMSNTFAGFCEYGIRIGKKRPYQCICGTDFDTQDDAERHVELKYAKCMDTALKIDARECKVCNLEFNGPVQLKRHMNTNGHKNKVDQPLKCKVCNIKCRGQKEMTAHLKTKKHLARVEGPPLELECKLCNIRCLSQKQMKTHLATKKHIKNGCTSSPLIDNQDDSQNSRKGR